MYNVHSTQLLKNINRLHTCISYKMHIQFLCNQPQPTCLTLVQVRWIPKTDPLVVAYKLDAQPTASKHWKSICLITP